MLRRSNLTMMSLVLLLSASPFFATAQEGMLEEPEFKITDVPDKWKSESAVILAQKIDYAYVRKSMASAMTIKEYVRKRIRLQDKNALESFLNSITYCMVKRRLCPIRSSRPMARP